MSSSMMPLVSTAPWRPQTARRLRFLARTSRRTISSIGERASAASVPSRGRIGAGRGIRLRLGGANLSLKRVEFGGCRVDLPLQGLKLLLGGRGLGLSLGESPVGRINLPLQAGLLGREGLILALQRGGPIAFILELGVDGLQIARLGVRLLLRAGDGELGVADLFGEV